MYLIAQAGRTNTGAARFHDSKIQIGVRIHFEQAGFTGFYLNRNLRAEFYFTI